MKKKTLMDLLNIEDLGEAGYLFSLKEDVARTALLRFKGFGLQHDAFKIWNLDKPTASLMFIDTATNKSWTVNWGSSTTLTADTVWDQRNALLECLAEKFPETTDKPRMRKYDGRLLYV